MSNSTLITALVVSLILTLIIEVSFFLITGKRNKKDIWLVVLVNTLTNPIVVLLYWIAFFNTNWHPILIILPLEVFAILTEGYIYRLYSQTIKRPFLFSLAANSVSFSIGFVITNFLF